MSVSHFLYQLLIGPLELIFEAAYGVAYLVLNNCGLAIFALSLTMNFLLLPLYRRADVIQAEERAVEERLAPWVSHIKKSFTGDERFMMLQTYYRQNNYRPFYALKGSLPLLLEIPFFIAAYHFLSNLSQLRGMPFGSISDLGAPDALLSVGGLTVHLLPVLMTLINLVSSAIYTKGFPLKDKLQLYGMALIFLVLLYDSPSGLVLYWTLNNLFSLAKNVFCKAKNPRKLLFGLFAAAGAALLVFGLFFYHPGNWKNKPLVIGVALLLELPALLLLFRRRIGAFTSKLPEKGNTGLFFTGCAFLALLTGVLIPSAVISSAPGEFVLTADFYTPLRHVLNASLLSFGLFVIWLGVFFFISGRTGRWAFGLAVWVLSVIAIADYMFFGTSLGTLSAELKYEAGLNFSMREKLLNLAIVLVMAILLCVVYVKKRRIAFGVYAVILTAVFGMSVINVVNIQRSVPELRETAESMPGEKASFTLSKQGKNVIVLMLDRAISGYLPYLFAENPELEQQFDGFTYYPNTISHGYSTNTGSAGLYGGYEYVPEAMNARADELLADKQNEALKVLPVLFSENGYEVTVCDPPYAGYSQVPDLSIYDEYPAIRTYNTEYGQFLDTLMSPEEAVSRRNQLWERNFFCFSVMKITPVILQVAVYYHGSYFSQELRAAQVIQDLSHAKGQRNSFLESYSVLRSLPDMTRISDGEQDAFLAICNSTTHEPMLLQEPAYEPTEIVDNTAYDAGHMTRFTREGHTLRVDTSEQMTHYQVNMAAYIQLGRWFDTLRESGVYDNTRIIIAADHGLDLGQFGDLYPAGIGLDVQLVAPLLLVKDFDSHGFTTDDRFMTNADVPALAVKDTIDNPVNPFTGKLITGEEKLEKEQLILVGTEHRPEYNNGTTFLPGTWFSVHDDIFNAENWTLLGVH